MIPVVALCVAVAALAVFALLLRKGLRRDRPKRRYFAVDLAPKPAAEPVRSSSEH